MMMMEEDEGVDVMYTSTPQGVKRVLSFSSECDSGVDICTPDATPSSSRGEEEEEDSCSRVPPPPLFPRQVLRSGKKRVDFMRILEEMNAGHLILLTGSFLRGNDFLSMSLVSRSWNKIVRTYFDEIRREHVLSLKLDWENSGSEDYQRTRSTPRKAMANVSNILKSSDISKRDRTASTSQAQSPSKIRHRLFTEEASKLGPGEFLQSCPRCTNPSRVIPSELRATCSRLSCGFEFCTRCMCAAHLMNEDMCRTPTKSSGKVLHKSTVSTKKSRRRLKRL